MLMRFNATFLGAMAAVLAGTATAGAVTYEFTPADNAEIDQLKTIQIYTPYEEDVITYRSKPTIKINGNDVSTTAKTSGEYYDTLTFTLDEAYDTPGSCTVTIPARTFFYGMGETDNSEITLNYTIKDNGTVTPPVQGDPYDNPGATITPAQGAVASLHSFEIYFSGYSLLDTNNSRKASLINDANGQTVATGTGTDGTGFSSMIVTLDREVTEPGTYTLKVTEGLFYDMYTDEDVPETNWRYTIGGGEQPPVEEPEVVTATPADESTVEQLSTITIAFPEAQGNVVYPRENATYTITDAEGNPVASGTPERVTLQADAVAINLATPITANGTYTVTIPKNCILLGEDTELQRMNRTVKLTYTVKAFEIPPVSEYDGISIDPAQGDVSYLHSFTVKVTRVQFADINFTKQPQLVNLRTGEVAATGKAEYGAFISDVVIDLDKEVTEAGVYYLHLPEGTIYDGTTDEDLEEMNFLYVVDGLGNKPIEIPDNFHAEPAEGEISGPWKSVALVYPDVTSVYKHDNDGVRLTNEAGEEVTAVTMILGDYSNEMNFVFRNEVNTTGTYVLEIPARAMVLGDMKDSVFSKAVRLTYRLTQTGLEFVGADGGEASAPVYNLQGIKVSEHSTENLPAGIYLSNGKKIVVK